MGLEFSITINAPREFIFDFFEDGRKMVELVPEHFVGWEQVGPEENGIRLVKATDKIMFGPGSTKTIQEKVTRPEQIRSEVIEGDGKGTVTIIEFSAANPSVTVLKMSTELKGSLARWLGRALSPVITNQLKKVFRLTRDRLESKYEDAQTEH